ncbi:MAG TPA: serine/threonine-protein kinase [Steroidobacteraceae bacterium]|jgi:serine/threonine-protein kinase
MSLPSLDPSLWQELSGYLDRALDLPSEARERWLAGLAATQPLIAAALQDLLAERDALNACGFLQNPPRAVAELRKRHSLAGKQIGAYTLDRLIGRGGMGEVWLASRSDGRFEGHCAIKFLDRLGARPKVAERFRHEGRLLGRLGHPNIARLLDAGSTDDGHPFLVLEYVDGEHIDHYCTAHALDVDARVRLFLDAVAAVAHAHSQLIVHRDLKPSNVLVTRDGMVKLLDFGIAKLLNPERTLDDAATTRAEEIVLTPEYAAPEQLLGDVPSTATDVYQLGMLLYVLLAGGHPLHRAGTRVERVKAALDGNLPRASQFVANEPLQRKLRGDLDAILARAMSVNPRERYQTAAALREELVRYLEQEPVDARSGVAFYQTRRFIRRHLFSVVGSATAIAALCATLVFALTQARAAATERDRAFALATRNTAVTDFLGMLITEAAEAGTPVTVSDMLARSERLALADTSGSPENRAAVLGMIATRYGSLGDDAKAARLLESGLALITASPDAALRSRLTCAHALSIASLGQASKGVSAIAHELNQLRSDPESAAYCLLYRAFIADSDGDAPNALSYATQALDAFRAAPRRTAVDEGLFLGAVGFGYHLNQRNREADEYYRRAVEKYTELHREGGPDAIAVRNNWAVVFDDAGVPRRALEIYDETLRAFIARNPDGLPPAYLIGNRARALERVGRRPEAAAAYQRAFDLAGQQGNTPGQLYCLLGLAATAQESNDLAAAAAYLDRAGSLMDPGLRQNPPRMSRALVLSRLPAQATVALIQGRLDVLAGRYGAARIQLGRAIADGNPAVITSARWAISEVQVRTGDARGAAESARQALASSIEMQGGLPHSINTGHSYLRLARALQQLEEPEQARAALASALDHLSSTVDEDHPLLVQARQLAAQNL